MSSNAFGFRAQLHTLEIEARYGHIICSFDDERWIQGRLRARGGYFRLEQTIAFATSTSRNRLWTTLKNTPFLLDGDGDDGYEPRLSPSDFESEEEEDDADSKYSNPVLEDEEVGPDWFFEDFHAFA